MLFLETEINVSWYLLNRHYLEQKDDQTTFLTNTSGFTETLDETLNCRLIWHYRVWERIRKRILTFCIWPSGKIMFKYKNTLILRKKNILSQITFSLDWGCTGWSQGRASTCGSWWGNSCTNSKKMTTSIMVKFSLVTDLWVAWLLDHSVLKRASASRSNDCCVETVRCVRVERIPAGNRRISINSPSSCVDLHVRISWHGYWNKVLNIRVFKTKLMKISKCMAHLNREAYKCNIACQLPVQIHVEFLFTLIQAYITYHS
jgi:hypothetical protein